MYTIELSRPAAKAFDALMHAQPELGRRVANALDRLAEDPEVGIPLRRELKGLRKYRVGSYRIIYQIHRGKLLVTVIDLGDRKDIYR